MNTFRSILALSLIAIILGASGIVYSYTILTKVSDDIESLRELVKTYGEVLGVSGAEYAKKIVNARKEGKVVLYTSEPTIFIEQLSEAFEKKYPFLKVECYRSTSRDIFQKVSEAGEDKYAVDVVLSTTLNIEMLKGVGLLRKYNLTEDSAYLKGFRDPDGYWYTTRINTFSIIYNAKLIPPSEAPADYKDLLDDRWRGKIGMDDLRFGRSTATLLWFVTMRKVLKDDWRPYMEGLAKQGIVFKRGQMLLNELCKRGEIPIIANGITIYAEQDKAKGDPIEWVKVKPIFAERIPIAIHKMAPHPNAAELFVDFMLSQEGQRILGELGLIPSRLDVPLKFSALSIVGKDVLLPDVSDFKSLEGYIKVFDEIFFK